MPPAGQFLGRYLCEFMKYMEQDPDKNLEATDFGTHFYLRPSTRPNSDWNPLVQMFIFCSLSLSVCVCV